MKQHLQTAWNHIRRSPYQSLVALGVMFLAFFLSSVVILVASGSQEILSYFETRPQVTAFFEDEVSPDQVELLKGTLLQTGKVKEVRYVSKEEALVIYQEQNRDDPLLLEMVTANILPASLEVSTTEIAYLDEVAQVLANEPGVEEVIFQEEVVDTLKTWTLRLRQIGLALVIFLGLVSFSVILVIIGMKVALRKTEFEILRLLGATNWYIRSPFILEGIFYGTLGALLGGGLAFVLLLYATPVLIEFLAGVPLFPLPWLFVVAFLGVQILAGVLIGALGSLLAVVRYLK